MKNTTITISSRAAIEAVENAYEGYGCVEEALVENGVSVEALPDNHTGISLYDEEDGSLTVVFHHDEEYMWTEFTGHMYYRSPYESCDSCGNCDGARCEYCREVTKSNVVKVEKNYLRKFVAHRS